MTPLRSKAFKAAASLAGFAGITVGLGIMAIQGAEADPGTATAYVGVGSDTTQDVMDALAGQSPWAGSGSQVPKLFTPALSGAASRYKTIVSWDAIPFGGSASAPGSIIPKYGAPSIDRPNGSSNGITALNDAINNVPWVASTGSATINPVVIGSGNLDFARSSRGPKTTGNGTLTFVPFARDAVTYVYESNSPTAVADVGALNHANIAAALAPGASGHFTSGGTEVYACLAQPGSGTRSFWEGAIGITNDTAAGTAASLVNPGCNTLQEHSADSFDTLARSILSTRPNSAVIVPMSAAQYTAQANGFGVDRSAAFRAGLGTTAGYTVGIGDPDGVAGPTGPLSSATPGSAAGNPAFYSFVSPTDPIGTYGRDVYNVIKTSRLGALGDAGLKDIFTSTTNPNGICGTNGRNIVRQFGFLDPVLPCGNTTLTADN